MYPPCSHTSRNHNPLFLPKSSTPTQRLDITNDVEWIIGGRSTVSRRISKCVTCRKLRSRPLTQKMLDLREEHVSPTALFQYTSMDVFGPLNIKEGRKSLKRYGLVFTCLASRAVQNTSLSITRDKS